MKSLLALGASLVVLASCSPRVIGYAVVLWPEADSSFSAGDILAVTETSRIQNTVTVQTQGESRTLDINRITLFDEKDPAQSFARDFEPWQDTYARSLRTALPVRAMPDRTTTRLYRLRDGEVVKILGRTDEMSNEAGLLGYWYQALTESGITGWVFGRSIELISAGGRPLDASDDQDQLDRLVRDISSSVWRPLYFEEMIRSGQINLELFSPRFGLFGDLDDSSFRIVLPTYEREFSYQEYQAAGLNAVRFEEADLTLTLGSNERLEATFLLNDRQRRETFFLIDDDLQEIIQEERDRRREVLEEFLSRGSGLVSTAFGSMELDERGGVRWEGYQRLVPDILPAAFTGRATMEFSIFIAGNLRSRYDGAVRLRMQEGRSSAFLYTLTDDGVRFVYIPESAIDDRGVIQSEPATPIVLFFRFYQE
ncbi:hypothetical protein AU468_13140 [Alkalispirochaeta sphaeroplastigenens]|uniref:SH3b domain-containing protein n=1 Tax=Alkalispirochaeta sphaeroplastigenens TaxID=1187066 RepID=A0A2S4JG86_9SPIO|nr:SH3 domain-containing protein [Alkalispirochaeta sphaeroplastigenens]POQ98523.1 hypothetical protein AU468_13140 [Alkalispirochaeta sphaeroplastigenens]